MSDETDPVVALAPQKRYAGDEELRSWLSRYIAKRPQHTTVVLSRSQYIGISRKALDAYLNGTYFLPKDEGGMGGDPATSRVEEAIRRFRERIEIAGRCLDNRFLETRCWRRLEQACSTALLENVIIVVYGKPGSGKSRCLAEYASRHLVTAPITLLCSANVSPHYFMQKLAAAFGYTLHASTGKLEDIVAERLRRTPRPIFVDQANYLDERSLGSLCYIWEKAQIPIVLVGTQSLYDAFNSSHLTRDVRAQISSRVAMHYLLSELTLGEAKTLIGEMLGKDATDETVTRIYNLTGGSFRHLELFRPRYEELKRINREELRSGEVKMDEIILSAAARLMAG